MFIFNSEKDRWLSGQTILVLSTDFVYAASQYDRGKFIEVSLIIATVELISKNKKAVQKLINIGIISTLVALICINANGRLYGYTGILTIPKAVPYGIEMKVKNPFSIFPEVALVMTTSAIKLKNEGVRLPPQNIFYQINPFPSFLLPDNFKPDFFIERILGTYGSSGTPLPLMAFSYLCFGVNGLIIFIFVGLYFRHLSKLLSSKLPSVFKFSVAELIYYPVSVTGLMYTLLHGEPRGSIRMVLYAWLLVELIKQLFPSTFIKQKVLLLNE